MEAPDNPGVLARISGVFSKKKISIQEVVQRESKGRYAQIVIILHENREKDVQDALKDNSKASGGQAYSQRNKSGDRLIISAELFLFFS